MVKYFVKKWLLKQINQILESISKNDKVVYWKNKIAEIITLLSEILKHLDDNKITEEEITEITDKCKKLF